MKKEEFLSELRYALHDIAADDLRQIEEYYRELILDAMEQGYSEEEILEGFGSPEEVAARVRTEYGGMVVYTGNMDNSQTPGYQSSELVHTIKVEASGLRIRMRAVEAGPVRVLFNPRENYDKVTFSEENGIFSFRHETKGLFHLNWLNLFLDFNILILEVPKDFAGKLVLRTSNASIRASNLTRLTKGEFTTMNGKITLKNICSEEVFLKTANAFLDMSALNGRRLEAITNNGNVTARECDFSDGILLQTKNGFVTGRNLIGNHISMQSCNGSVTGTVIGNIHDYTVDSHTVNGSNNLECAAGLKGPKKLTARTTNGRIHVEFIQ